MDEQSGQNSNEVHPQLLSEHRRIMHVQNLPSDQKHNSEWKVPAERNTDTLKRQHISHLKEREGLELYCPV